MPRVPLKNYYTINIIYAQSACHIVYHVIKYAQSYGGGGFSGTFFVYKDTNQTEIFTGVKTKNDIYYRGEKHC